MSLDRSFTAAATALAALALSGPPLRAQQPARQLTGPPQEVHFDLITGTMTRGPVVQPRSVTTCVSLDNSDWSLFASVDSGSCAVEWITQAVKSGGKSEIVTGFEFGYASTARDTTSGGSGGQLQIAFREGYLKGSVNGAGTTGTEVARFLITGLPALTNCRAATNPAVLPAIGTVKAVIPPMCLADGNIGWTWKFVDIGSDGNAKTFPLLGCISSCNGPGPDALGMTNLIDRYQFGAYLDTIALPGATFASSVLMKIHELPTVPGQSVAMNGTGVNPNILTSINPPAIDSPWTIRLDCTGAAPNRAAIFRIGFTGVRPPVTTSFGELLVQLGGAFGTNLVIAPHGGGPVNLNIPLPKNPNLVCLTYGVQGLCGDNPQGYLSNALMETVGTP